MTRLDKYLYEKKFVNTRTRAQNLIELGKVTVNGKTCIKSSLDVSESDKIELNENYEASLAAIKLEKAINEFKPDIRQNLFRFRRCKRGFYGETFTKRRTKNLCT